MEAEFIPVEPACLPWQAPQLMQIKELQRQGRLPHAILFNLPAQSDGPGLIWYLSMLLLCREASGDRVCGVCDSCRLMSANSYPDFRLVGLEYDEKTKKINKNIKIEQIRDLIHEVHLTRSHDNLKILVIYPAEKMSIGGANSLLKTLEEPAERVLIMLVTHHPNNIPVTLRSRCQKWGVDIAPESAQAVQWLETRGMSAPDIDRYLRITDGNPELAFSLYQSGFFSLLEEFKQKFSSYLANRIDIPSLVAVLKSADRLIISKLLTTVIRAYSYRFSGLGEDGSVVGKADPVAAQAMTEMFFRVEKQLRTDENNLDFQLQLEDVLISIKQIVKSNQ